MLGPLNKEKYTKARTSTVTKALPTVYGFTPIYFNNQQIENEKLLSSWKKGKVDEKDST